MHSQRPDKEAYYIEREKEREIVFQNRSKESSAYGTRGELEDLTNC